MNRSTVYFARQSWLNYVGTKCLATFEVSNKGGKYGRSSSTLNIGCNQGKEEYLIWKNFHPQPLWWCKVHIRVVWASCGVLWNTLFSNATIPCHQIDTCVELDAGNVAASTWHWSSVGYHQPFVGGVGYFQEIWLLYLLWFECGRNFLMKIENAELH